jgi:predicted AlkP superfamily pyrophosphatase or phosphodiesterase
MLSILRLGPRLLLAAAVLGAALSGSAAAQPRHKLLIVSVDGLDWRYLRDKQALGLKIPYLTRLMAEGAVAQGVIGVWPTITWPSHTSIITGARPDQHGILGNQRPKSEGGDYYWTVDFLKAPTLWGCARQQGLTTASITWPVTTDAPITWNIPEYFKRRNGGSMDLASAQTKATPGLVDGITRMFPSFPQQWLDDRTRTQAVLYLLKDKRPDLILVHLVDLDSEAHDQGPFDTNANAILERTDELIGDMAAALPKDYDLVITSDHGFERLDRIANLAALMAKDGVKGELQPMGGIVTTQDPSVAAWLRAQSNRPDGDIGREIPHDELAAYAPKLADVVAAFEPADHVMFGRGDAAGAEHAAPREKGEHGFWPLRRDYRSVFIAYGPGVPPGALPELQMVDLKDRLAALLGITCKSQP